MQAWLSFNKENSFEAFFFGWLVFFVVVLHVTEHSLLLKSILLAAFCSSSGLNCYCLGMFNWNPSEAKFIQKDRLTILFSYGLDPG